MTAFEILNTGSCTAPGKIAATCWSWKKRQFPATVAVIEHPREGFILFDTGYTDAFFEASKSFPYRLYQWVTPVDHDSKQSLRHQLETRGIAREKIRWIFISHFHADHICGLKDFPQARFICSAGAANETKGLKGWSAVRKAFLPALMPDDFFQRVRLLETKDEQPLSMNNFPFPTGIDLFQDKRLIAIPLPGHATGQLGLLIDEKYFLIADAAWSSEALKQGCPPYGLAHLLHSGKADYLDTFAKLQQLSLGGSVEILPCHCPQILERGSF